MQTGGTSSVKRTRMVFACLVVAVCFLRAWYSESLPLTGDEAYHWEWSRHLSGGYYDHPPLTAYVIRATSAFWPGASELGVRFGAILLLAGASVAIYIFARRLARDGGISFENAERAGWTAGFLVLFVPLLAGLGVYMSTDPVVVFFCALSLPAVYSAVTRGGWLRWMAAGAVAGLALLSKFLCLFTFAGMFLFLLLSQEDRKWFIRPQPYVAALIAIAVFSPFLLWNYSHDWATFKFNLVTRQSQNAFAPSHIPEFIGAQMFAVSPFVFVLGVAGLVSAWKAWKMEKARPLMYLLCAAAVPLAYFLVASFRRRVGLHWPACGWLPVLVLLPLMHVRGRLSLLWMRIMLWSCLALTILIHVALVTPPGMLRRVEAMMGREPVRFEDERYGWREIGGWVESVRERMAVEQGEKQRGVFLMTGQYGVSAALAFYMPGQPAVHLWAPRRTHGENYRFWDDFRSMALQDAIYVAKSEDRASGAMEMLRRHFTYVHDPEKLTVKVDGEEVRSFYIIKCFIYDGVEPDFSG